MRNDFNNVFKNKRVAVIGHTGFKGSWLSLWLTELGAKVSGYALQPPTDPNLFDILHMEKRINHSIGDIRDLASLENFIGERRPEIIFHLAAQPLVRVSYTDPLLTHETNILGTVHLLEAVRRTGCARVVVNVTTDKCYENRELSYAYRETDPLGGYDPYSASKACSEIVTASYRKSFFNPADHEKKHSVSLATARAGNVIGGGDFALDRLVPDCARALSKNETIITRNPRANRPWQHVLEPLSGYLLLVRRMIENPVKYCEAWNFGPADDSVITVENVIKKCIKYWGEGDYKVVPDGQYHEANLLKLDINKAKNELSWEPKYPIDASIKRTMEWYRRFYSKDRSDMLDLTLSQIAEF